jgi:cold shock CspA family protein
MRGVIQSFDAATGFGTIRAKDGTLHPFARTNLIRRSKPPHASARVVFRLKDGKIYRAAVVPDRRRPDWGWDMAFWPWEWLLFIP